MKFVLLSYGMDPETWDDGRIMFLSLSSESKSQAAIQFLDSPLNHRWHELAKQKVGRWPHPNRILTDLLRICPTTVIDWVPELNYLGIYVEDDKVLSYLENNHSALMSQ